ncbi:MAG: amidase family protein [Bacteroidales bacterium]
MDFSFNHVQSQIKEGTLDLSRVVHYFLSNLQQHAKLNAFVEVYANEALTKADSLHKQWEQSGVMPPFMGLIVTVKDLIAHKDHALTAASGLLQGYVSPFSATVIERLEQAGAIVLGRTNCDEFGMGSTGENSFYGPTFNALDPQYVAGGSSSGAATTVAANMCHLALGTDTGGSVRQPAAFQGVYGFKPTYGRLSRWGVVAYASSFDQVGLLAHDPLLMAQVMQLLARPDERDLHTSRWQSFQKLGSFPENPRVAIDKELFQKPFVAGSHAILWHHFFRRTQSSHFRSISLPSMEEAIALFHILAPCEAASNLNRYDGIRYGITGVGDNFSQVITDNRTKGFGREVKRRILTGNYFLTASPSGMSYEQAVVKRQELMTVYEKLFSEVDFILLPTTYSGAFKPGDRGHNVLEAFREDRLLVIANILGCPAISVPIFVEKVKFPLGLQIMAAPGKDEELLDFAARATDFF